MANTSFTVLQGQELTFMWSGVQDQGIVIECVGLGGSLM